MEQQKKNLRHRLVVGVYLSLSGRGRGGRLFTFSAFRMGAYSRWALILINERYIFHCGLLRGYYFS